MGSSRRDLDIVVYGATGFIGKLTANYLANSRAEIRVALAGRSLDRLHAVRRSLGTAAQEWRLIVADVSQPEALRAMAARTQVVVNAVGPYTTHGLPVVAACAATGTDYADLTGEVPFVRNSIDLYHSQAIESGSRIVHSCGFDSIPSDVTAYALHRRAADDTSGELGDTTLVLRDYSGGYAGGSIATMVELMRIASDDAGVRRMLDDPYSLSPDRGAEPDVGDQPDLPLCRGAQIAPELTGLWAGGYVMALYNTRCVRRSNALLGLGLRPAIPVCGNDHHGLDCLVSVHRGDVQRRHRQCLPLSGASSADASSRLRRRDDAPRRGWTRRRYAWPLQGRDIHHHDQRSPLCGDHGAAGRPRLHRHLGAGR